MQCLGCLCQLLDILSRTFTYRYLALLERLSSLGFCLDPVPNDPAMVARVLFGCWCKTSSSLAVVPSVSSLWTHTGNVQFTQCNLGQHFCSLKCIMQEKDTPPFKKLYSKDSFCTFSLYPIGHYSFKDSVDSSFLK